MTAVRHSQELATYEHHRANLERRHQGQIVLLHGNELIGPFAALGNAIAAVMERFGRPEQCLWQEIGAPVAPRPLWGLPDDQISPMAEPAAEVYFARELAAYEGHRAKLEREHWGEFAVLCGSELIGVFTEEYEALAEGERRFGLGKFLLVEVGDPIYSFPNCVLPHKASR